MLEKIRLLIFDVDGILTDGRIVLDGEGREIKAFDVQDGAGIKYAMRAGLKVALITGRSSPAVAARAKELGIEDCYQGAKSKRPAYEELCAKHGLSDEAILVMGDDLPDLPLMRRAGFSATVPAARPEVLKQASYVTRAAGGRGAAREVIELVLKQQGLWGKILERYFGSDAE